MNTLMPTALAQRSEWNAYDRRSRGKWTSYDRATRSEVDFLNVERDAAYNTGWWRHARSGGISKSEHRALSRATGPAGAYTVPQDFNDQITTALHARSVIGRLAREITTSTGDDLPFPLATAHGAATWTAENAAATLTDDVFGQITLSAFAPIRAIVVSYPLSQDAVSSFDAYLADETAAGIADLEGAAFATGSGTGQPQGCAANFTQLQAPTGNTTTYRYDDLVNALHTVPARYRNRDGAPIATWVVSDGALKALRNVRDADGNKVLIDPTIPGNPPMMLGYPVEVDEHLPNPAANAKSVLFAGWNDAYAVRRVQTMALQRLDELFATNGQLGYIARWRVDGRVLNATAGVALQNSAT